MKKVLVILFILFTSAAILAQTEQEKEEALGGKYSLQFSIDSNFDLNSFDGSLISGKIQLGKDLALRGGVSISSFNKDGKNFQDRMWDNGINRSDTQKVDDSQFTLLFNSHLIWNVIKNSDVIFYIGGGPFIRLSDMKRDVDELHSERSDDHYGLDLINGAEWFVKNNISLFAEYGISIFYSDYYSEDDLGYELKKSENSTFHLNSPSARLGASLYF